MAPSDGCLINSFKVIAKGVKVYYVLHRIIEVTYNSGEVFTPLLRILAVGATIIQCGY